MRVEIEGSEWIVTVAALHDIRIEGPNIDEFGSLTPSGVLEDFVEVPERVLAVLQDEIVANSHKIRL